MQLISKKLSVYMYVCTVALLSTSLLADKAKSPEKVAQLTYTPKKAQKSPAQVKKAKPSHAEEKSREKSHKIKSFQHNIQLQLSDSLGFPVDGTKFWVTLDIIKEGPKVTIQFPVINFQTGQGSTEAPSFIPPLVNGGYLYTSDGFLPENIRPTDLINRSLMGASNNGASPTFSYSQDPSTLPQPPTGYILQITNAGAIVVQCAGTFGNIIPPGPQTLLPSDITYIVKPTQKLCKNTAISRGSTNTTQFSNASARNDAIRDSHVNDAHNGVFAWTWCDNSMIVDKTNGTVNAMVAIGSLDKKGHLKVGKPVQLTNLPPGVMAWDTAVAIDRSNPKNIVVSYGVLNHNVHPTTSVLARAVSTDGGKTWQGPYDGINPLPLNGPLANQPVNGFGDARGVASDIFGNIWYGANEIGTGASKNSNPPIFYTSTDGGITFTRYTQALLNIPAVTYPPQFWDYPQYCFGGDPNDGTYGLYFVADLANVADLSGTPAIWFLPINGPLATSGPLPAATYELLPQFQNSCSLTVDLTASLDGRVWLQGITNPIGASSYIAPATIVFKSPGALGDNYAGPWDFAMLRNFFLYSFIGLPSGFTSQPERGYFVDTSQSIIFDNKRQALYSVCAFQTPDNSQNMRLVFMISRDNGQTWSTPIDIANTNFANRGFQSMALDDTTGDLVFCWYDGRHDPTFQSLEYYGAVIPACKLDSLVNSIPLSDPRYIIPAPDSTALETQAMSKIDEERLAVFKQRFKRRFER